MPSRGVPWIGYIHSHIIRLACSQISAFQFSVFQSGPMIRNVATLVATLVASLLPVVLSLKHLTDNDVTDVATLGTAITFYLFSLVGRKSRFISAHLIPAAACYDGAMVNSNFTWARARLAEMAAATAKRDLPGLCSRGSRGSRLRICLRISSGRPSDFFSSWHFHQSNSR